MNFSLDGSGLDVNADEDSHSFWIVSSFETSVSRFAVPFDFVAIFK